MPHPHSTHLNASCTAISIFIQLFQYVIIHLQYVGTDNAYILLKSYESKTGITLKSLLDDGLAARVTIRKSKGNN